MSQEYKHQYGHSHYHHEEYSMSSMADEFELPIFSDNSSKPHKPLTHSSSSNNYNGYRSNEASDHNLHRNVHKVPSHNDEYHYARAPENTHRDRHASKGFGVNHSHYNTPEAHKKVQFVELEVEPRGGDYKAYEEEKSIDSEADGFIKQIRKKFDRSRSR